jgi:SAM-dependent methyltransferase
MNCELNNRVAEEKAFHNSRFNTEILNRSRGSKYYLALEYWYIDYFTAILQSGRGEVLELGSGIESIAVEINNANYTLYSIDISDEAVAYADRHKTLPSAIISVDDAHSTKFASKMFDLVVGRGILHHLDLQVACNEINRVLKPEGKIIFGEPLDCNVIINLYRKLTPKIRSRDERPLSAEMLNFIQAEFHGLHIQYYGFLTLGPSILGLKSPRWLHWFDRFLLNTLGLGRYLAWACLISSSKNN